MADTLMSDAQSFLEDVVHDLTNLHVNVAQALNAPYDQKAVEALGNLPAGLIDRAQDLSARLEKANDDEPKAAAKSKPAAKR